MIGRCVAQRRADMARHGGDECDSFDSASH